jgi:hypothetical protein
MQRTASATLDVGSIIAAASSMRRFALYELIAGSEATPGDFAFLWEIYKRTGLATGGTAPNIQPLDAAESLAATVVANQAPTANGAGGSTNIFLSMPLNQRATFRWVAAPGGELIAPATASNGFGVATPTAGALVAVTALAHIAEY